MEMDQLVSDVNILYVSVKAGAVISCYRAWWEVGATFTAVTSHELRKIRSSLLGKLTPVALWSETFSDGAWMA